METVLRSRWVGVSKRLLHLYRARKESLRASSSLGNQSPTAKQLVFGISSPSTQLSAPVSEAQLLSLAD